MMPLNHILRKYVGRCKITISQEKINPLMYMEDIKKGKELETLIQTVRIYSQDTGMEFGTKKCAMLSLRSGKLHMTEKIELPNQENIKILKQKETYKYLGILKVNNIKQVEMKEKIKKNKKST